MCVNEHLNKERSFHSRDVHQCYYIMFVLLNVTRSFLTNCQCNERFSHAVVRSRAAEPPKLLVVSMPWRRWLPRCCMLVAVVDGDGDGSNGYASVAWSKLWQVQLELRIQNGAPQLEWWFLIGIHFRGSSRPWKPIRQRCVLVAVDLIIWRP